MNGYHSKLWYIQNIWHYDLNEAFINYFYLFKSLLKKILCILLKESVPNLKDSEKKDEESSNISSYFADSGVNVFDSFGQNTQDEEKDFLQTNLFTSISISKSVEDILSSEINATEIKESDLLTDSEKSPTSEFCVALNRNESFKSSENLLEKEDFGDSFSMTETQKAEEVKDPKETVTHIYHREHSTSVSEPEAISFEGKILSLLLFIIYIEKRVCL